MKNSIPDLATATPAEIDAELFPAEERLFVAGNRLRQMEESKYRTESAVELLRAELQAAKAALAPLVAEYRRRNGWTRYIKVVGLGHVHSSTSCSTCFATTLFARVPALSGLTPEEMVEAVGDRACSVCYPWAPALPTYRPVADPEVVAAREARDGRRAELAAKRAANALESTDGMPLVDMHGWKINTVTAGKAELKHFEETELFGFAPDSWTAEHRAEQTIARDRIAAALAAKLGKPVESIIADAKRLARKSFDR